MLDERPLAASRGRADDKEHAAPRFFASQRVAARRIVLIIQRFVPARVASRRLL